MATAVSVSSAARDEKSFTGANFVPNPLYKSYDQAAELENCGFEMGKQVDADTGDEGPPTGSDCPRRLDDELTALSPEEIASRLERTRREFYNRRKIIIKNLPADISNQEVHELLSSYDLKYCFVDKYKGTAFVTLLNGEQAQFAIKEFHQCVLRDREISVQLQPTDALLCIANLPRAFTQQQFEELVRPFGNIERCFLVHSATMGHSKGYGFVEYMKKDSAARAKSELLGKQLGSRMLYVHWTEVGSLTFPMLHSLCLCVDRLPQNILTAQDLRSVLIDTHAPIFCQLAQGQDCNFRRFAVLEFSTPEMAEDVQRLMDGRALGGTHIRVSFCAPGSPGRSMLAALIAAQTMALNRGKGLLPEPNAMQILTGLNNPATLKMLLASFNPGHKQGLLGAAPAIPLLANPALSAALMQLLLQNQVQQAGLLSENPLAALPLQQCINMLGEMSQGTIASTLGLQSETLGPIKQPSLSRPLGRENETPAATIGFAPAASPALQGLNLPLLSGMFGTDGPTLPGASILGEPPKEVGVSQNPFLSASSLFASSGSSTRAHPYRKRTALGNTSNQRANHSIHSNYSQHFQESCTSEFPLHQDPLSHLYEQQEVLENVALPSYGLQHSRHTSFSDAGSPFNYPPSPPQSSYFGFGAHTNIPSTQLNKAVGMPPVTHSSLFSAAPGTGMKTPVGGQKRLFSRLIPSPEPSPESGYVGQHSQGLGGHYADSYLKRKRIF
ncbi:ribonucleoprotein PTB-binding 1-like isoform X1 [Sinocyclocheilus grahami]|uniref:Ribonucleoprotein PTB-binding 1 n=1 Tax=Sinocyclocheilus grahami TaxID=75366 RepID=A0A672QKE8_SINGR|nr:PREDICTED: ribonucleoprotein PTB-binding 1-like isoform X1 [Sinocyclocheilus grahami]